MNFKRRKTKSEENNWILYKLTKFWRVILGDNCEKSKKQYKVNNFVTFFLDMKKPVPPERQHSFSNKVKVQGRILKINHLMSK